MAPKGGRGGGGGGRSRGYGSSSSCPEGFSDSVTIAYFVFYIVFFLMILFIMMAAARTRKRHPHAKKLVGWTYGTALFLYAIGYGLFILGTCLRECQVGDYINDYLAIAITAGVLLPLAEFLLLVLVVWSLNKALRDPLGGRQFLFKISSAAMLAVVGCITCAVIGLSSYNTWTATDDGRGSDPLNSEMQQLSLAYYILYLLASVTGSAISVVTILALRSHGRPAGKLIAWVIVLGVSMFFWLLLVLIQLGSTLGDTFNVWSVETYEAFAFLIGFFQIFSLIVILHLSKSVDSKPGVAQEAYNQPTYTNTAQPAHAQPQFVRPQPQYGVNQGPSPQQQYGVNQGPPPQQQYGVNQGPTPQQHYPYNHTAQTPALQNYYTVQQPTTSV
ncbi:uncharacterized protein EI97DRAFT_89215 [Westerdykella ornata]|uniref:Uncharacterized protein n=1 Tax=Westerdykella ornata TaxID=318751 RepID=A0A6A6JEV1_WESOR|nr:uncharacterized protein EI97DRAFT_89215 [Westerdykella ornata]KAF2274795.1 hypothetical protein EI97DRAFT_89215 [Westerdykella ornata]